MTDKIEITDDLFGARQDLITFLINPSVKVLVRLDRKYPQIFENLEPEWKKMELKD